MSRLCSCRLRLWQVPLKFLIAVNLPEIWGKIRQCERSLKAADRRPEYTVFCDIILGYIYEWLCCPQRSEFVPIYSVVIWNFLLTKFRIQTVYSGRRSEPYRPFSVHFQIKLLNDVGCDTQGVKLFFFITSQLKKINIQCSGTLHRKKYFVAFVNS